MNANTLLRQLFAQLKACPSWSERFRDDVPFHAWENFKRHGWESGEEMTPAAMAGLVLHDPTFAQLLNEAERSQMSALAAVALGRYRHECHPPHQLGNLIANNLEES